MLEEHFYTLTKYLPQLMMINPLLSIFGTRSIFITTASSDPGFALNWDFFVSLTAHKAKHSSFCRNTTRTMNIFSFKPSYANYSSSQLFNLFIECTLFIGVEKS